MRVARCESPADSKAACSRVVGVVERVRAQLGEDGAHLVGARPCPRRRPRRRGSAPCSRARICGSLTFVDPVVDQAPERGDALVLHAVLGDVLRLGRARPRARARACSYGVEERAVAGQQVAALAGLEVGHQAQELLGVVGELEVVLHQALELLLELFVRAVGAREPDAEHARRRAASSAGFARRGRS